MGEPTITCMCARLVGAIIDMRAPSPNLAQPFPNIALTKINSTTRVQKKDKGRCEHEGQLGPRCWLVRQRAALWMQWDLNPMMSIRNQLLVFSLFDLEDAATMVKNLTPEIIMLRAQLMKRV
jgi:hypothetical protein